jgi:predicted flap endonuclease-1-like 5' DNA nuclease
MRQFVHPKNALRLLAGTIGLLFDRLAGQVPEATPGHRDDLTVIDGIGPTFGRRLNEAGVTTFEQLAGLTPEQVRRITHVAEWQADPADWITRARELAG